MTIIRYCVNVFYISTDDKVIRWCPPSDNSGKIYVNSRRGQVIIKNQNLHMTKQNTS
jgi:hypothetical protein